MTLHSRDQQSHGHRGGSWFFSVSFQFYRMIPEGNPIQQASFGIAMTKTGLLL
jgi:hypothetical protein